MIQQVTAAQDGSKTLVGMVTGSLDDRLDAAVAIDSTLSPPSPDHRRQQQQCSSVDNDWSSDTCAPGVVCPELFLNACVDDDMTSSSSTSSPAAAAGAAVRSHFSLTVGCASAAS